MNKSLLIVDDEPLARARLRKMVAEVPGWEIAGESANGREAVTFLRERRPDLVLLDVQMPEVDGFEVLRSLPDALWPAVIFVTAFDQHAVRAFEVHALDYLLKPVPQARLTEALRRASAHLENVDDHRLRARLLAWLDSTRPPPAYLSRVAVRSGSATLFVPTVEIDYIESAGNYAVVHHRTENHILRETLTNLESKLSPRLFQRISRSVLVNLDRVRGLQTTPRGESVAVLQDGRQLIMSRGFNEIQERLQYPDRRD